MRIAILGLGKSLELYKPEYDLTIGVNDIWQHVKTDVVVCLDQRGKFTPDRMRVIDSCKPKAFYSQIVAYDTRPDFFKIDLLSSFPERECNLDLPQFQKSLCSPFVAVQIAWRYYGATEIHLFGVDLTNHSNLDAGMCAKIKVHFINLKAALLQKGCGFMVFGSGILKDI